MQSITCYQISLQIYQVQVWTSIRHRRSQCYREDIYWTAWPAGQKAVCASSPSCFFILYRSTSRDRSSRHIQAVKSKIAFATDTWTTKQLIFTYSAIPGSFINDDWDLEEVLIDFNVLEDDEHRGQEAGKAFISSASKRSALDKISRSSGILYYYLA